METLYIIGWIKNCTVTEENSLVIPKTSNTELPYHLAIWLWGICMSTPKFVYKCFPAASFMDKNWKQSKCPPSNEWINKMLQSQ